jgi:hypothetical protein
LSRNSGLGAAYRVPVTDDLPLHLRLPEGVHRQVGAICVAATHVEFALSDAIVDLCRSNHVQILVQGERHSGLVRWLDRLLKGGVLDEGPTAELRALVSHARKLLEVRDQVVHSVWAFPNQTPPGHVLGTRTQRTDFQRKFWAFEELEKLRVDLEHSEIDINTAVHNALCHETGNLPQPRRDET